MSLKRTIYLDNAATTKESRASKKAAQKISSIFYNPNSIHEGGVLAKKLLQDSRKKIAKTLNCQSNEIIFTRGGTEAVNLAITGTLLAWQSNNKGKTPHVIINETEHSASIEAVLAYQKHHPLEIDYLSVNKYGLVNQEDVKQKLKQNTALVVCMYVNNETGAIMPIKQIAKIIRYYKRHHKDNKPTEYSQHTGYPLLFVDAIQATNVIPLNTLKLGADIVSISGSKIYGPKSYALIYKKRQTPIEGLIHGGTQEFNLRGGTEDVALAASLETALSIAQKNAPKEWDRLSKLNTYFVSKLNTLKNQEALNYNLKVISNPDFSAPHIVYVIFSNLSGERLVVELSAANIFASQSAACNQPGNLSHVLLALIKNEALKNCDQNNTGSIRFSFGVDTTKKDIDKTIKVLKKIFTKFNQEAQIA